MPPNTISLSGSRTLTLGDEDDAVFQVTEGAVELFLVWNVGQSGDRRHHFATLPAGHWIFDIGFQFRDYGVTLLAVGQAQTTITKFDSDIFKDGRDDMAPRLDEWITDVQAGIASIIGDLAPTAHLLAPGPTPAVTGHVSARDVPIWWEADRGSYYGVKEVDVWWLPLTTSSWTTFDTEFPASIALTSREFVQRSDWWDDLSRAHDLFLRTIQAGVTTRVERELTTREERTDLRQRAGAAAWETIANVLQRGRTAPIPLQESSSAQSVYAAFEKVARHIGATPVPPPKASMPDSSDDPQIAVAAAARASSLRYRRVLLIPNWQKENNGALVAQLGSEAVALLPEKSGRYQISRANGTTERLTAKTAMELAPFAFSLYRSLPDRPLKARDVVTFALRGNGRDFGFMGTLVIVTGLLGLIMPALTGRIFDVIIPQAERMLMVQIGVALVTAAIVKSLFELVRGLAMLRVQNRTDAQLQAAVWDRILKMPAGFFRKFTAGDLANRANGVSQVHSLLTSTGTAVLFALPVGLFNFFVMFHYNATLSLWGLGLSLLAVVATIVFNARQIFLLRSRFEIEGRLSGLVFQLINGVAKFRIAAAEHLAFAKWAEDYTKQERIAVQAGRWAVASHTFFSGFPLFTSVVIFAVVAHLMEAANATGAATTATFTVGSYLAFSAAFGALISSLTSISESSLDLLEIYPLLERTKPIFEAELEQVEAREHPGTVRGDIELSNITFRYAEGQPPVLDKFSLKIEQGEFVALVGPSGTGKSTILRLLLGFEKPEIGSVFFDSKDLHTLDLRALRRQIGVVMQNSTLIAGDIFRNIVGESNLTLDDAWHAAEMAGLADDIRAMPMQMHTVVSEGGTGFSGGQRQRLAIARALAHKPRVVLFDEATSALDNRTQATVTKSLEQLRATRLVIAHRLSTIAQADRIVVMQYGRIVENGTYEELMAAKGFFHDLAKRQLA